MVVFCAFRADFFCELKTRATIRHNQKFNTKMANEKFTDQTPDNAGKGASPADIAKAVASGIDAVFGPGFAQQLQDQAKARGASPMESENALLAFAGNLSDSDKQALIRNQESDFNKKIDDEINAKLGFDKSSQEALQALFGRIQAKPAAGDAAQPTDRKSVV